MVISVGLTNIYLARHGETEYNRKSQIQGRGIDAPLNDTGVKQARAIGHYLSSIPINRIISSNLKRSKQTAQVVAGSFGLDIESHADLDEMNFGILEGRPISEIKNELESLHNRWKSGNVEYAMEQGESPSTVLNRAGSRAQSIIKNNESSHLLFVLHGRLLRILLSDWLNYGLKNMHRIPHTNGALYHVQWNGKGFEEKFLNMTDHLSAEYKHQETAS